MKTIFEEKPLLVTLIIDAVVTLGLPFVVHFLCISSGITNFAYPLLFAIFAVVNGLLTYIVGDVILISYKTKNDLVTTPVPDEVREHAKHWRYPFLIVLLLDLVVFVVFCIIFSATGHWPLL